MIVTACPQPEVCGVQSHRTDAARARCQSTKRNSFPSAGDGASHLRPAPLRSSEETTETPKFNELDARGELLDYMAMFWDEDFVREFAKTDGDWELTDDHTWTYYLNGPMAHVNFENPNEPTVDLEDWVWSP